MNLPQSGTVESGASASRTVILASTDVALRARLRANLMNLRWQVREASGGAEAVALLDEAPAEALMLDSWLPDLDTVELVCHIRSSHPGIDLLRIDGTSENEGVRSPRRNELLYALREGAGCSAGDRHGCVGRGGRCRSREGMRRVPAFEFSRQARRIGFASPRRRDGLRRAACRS